MKDLSDHGYKWEQKARQLGKEARGLADKLEQAEAALAERTRERDDINAERIAYIERRGYALFMKERDQARAALAEAVEAAQAIKSEAYALATGDPDPQHMVEYQGMAHRIFDLARAFLAAQEKKP